MAWLKKVKHHECNTPTGRRVGIGSIWQCRKCKQRWRLDDRFHSPTHLMVVYRWRCVPEEVRGDG